MDSDNVSSVRSSEASENKGEKKDPGSTKHPFFLGGLFLVLFLVSFFAWFTSDEVMTASPGGGWTEPLLFFSLLLAFESLVFVVVKSLRLRIVALFGAFLPSFLFVFEWMHVVVLTIGLALAWTGLYRMRSDVATRISIQLTRSLHLGMLIVAVGVSLALSSHYYFRIRSLSLEELLPRFRVEETSGDLAVRSLSVFHPELKQIQRDQMTVDEFLLTFQKSSIDPVLADPTLSEMERQLALEEARRQLSESVGQSLVGNEKVSDVLAQVMNRKMKVYFEPSTDTPFPLFPFILSLLLFLTLFSLSSFVQWVWIWLAAAIFALWARLGLVTIKKVTVQQEVIE